MMVDNSIIEKCNDFAEMQVWTSLTPKLDHQGWLNNFKDSERDYALSILSSFFFFNEKMCDDLLKYSFENIFIEDANNASLWEDLKNFGYFTTIDKDHNGTASGYIYLRKTKHVLGISQTRILVKQDVIEKLQAKQIKYLIFVDDFLGSGEQFIEAWEYKDPSKGHNISYADLLKDNADVKVFFLPGLACRKGMKKITDEYEYISIFAGNILDEKYNIFHKDTHLIPESQKQNISDVVMEASNRAGIINWKGWGDLGLTIAFHHNIPDGSLPLLWWSHNNWQPLMERR